jgi:hypothetical protein
MVFTYSLLKPLPLSLSMSPNFTGLFICVEFFNFEKYLVLKERVLFPELA